MTLVVDANVVFEGVASGAGMTRLAAAEAVGPPLLWPEVRSALHVAVRRGVLGEPVAQAGVAALESGGVSERRHRRLGSEAWRIADELGWAKTYDAEYLALASLLDSPLASFDRRVLRAAAKLGIPTYSFR